MKKIVVLGLGSGDPDHITVGVYRRLTSSEETIMLRTEKHPSVSYLRENGVQFESYDHVYETSGDFEEAYKRIVSELIERAHREGHVTYAVPGHPMVAERTVQMLLEQGEQQGVTVEILGGESFLDPLFALLGIDPIAGFTLLDAMTLRREQLNPSLHTVIGQVYDAFVASEVKLTLMEVYPDEYPVKVVTAAGVRGLQEVREIPLYELDRLQGIHQLTAVYVPPGQEESLFYRQFFYLREIIATLRSPQGCPWDKKQTHHTLRKYLIEETYETVEAIDMDNMEQLCDELGDVLLQILLHAQIAEEDGIFSIDDVINNLTAKMIRRHPHVFGDGHAEDAAEVTVKWEEIKQKEKRDKGEDTNEQSLLDGIPNGLPAVYYALKLQKKAAKVGFDWEKIDEVAAKVEEEWEELKMAPPEKRLEELGDLLFAIINLARFYGLDPEEALSSTNRKFKQRFSYIEKKLKEADKEFSQTNLEEMEAWWQEAKKIFPVNYE